AACDAISSRTGKRSRRHRPPRRAGGGRHDLLTAEEGLIALIAGPDVLRFAPALNIPLADIAEAFVRLDRAVARLTR
ncbi:hypothetical protein CQA65_30145, partial [Klebsiella pneumoniae]